MPPAAGTPLQCPRPVAGPLLTTPGAAEAGLSWLQQQCIPVQPDASVAKGSTACCSCCPHLRPMSTWVLPAPQGKVRSRSHLPTSAQPLGPDSNRAGLWQKPLEEQTPVPSQAQGDRGQPFSLGTGYTIPSHSSGVNLLGEASLAHHAQLLLPRQGRWLVAPRLCPLVVPGPPSRPRIHLQLLGQCPLLVPAELPSHPIPKGPAHAFLLPTGTAAMGLAQICRAALHPGAVPGGKAAQAGSQQCQGLLQAPQQRPG